MIILFGKLSLAPEVTKPRSPQAMKEGEDASVFSVPHKCYKPKFPPPYDGQIRDSGSSLSEVLSRTRVQVSTVFNSLIKYSLFASFPLLSPAYLPSTLGLLPKQSLLVSGSAPQNCTKCISILILCTCSSILKFHTLPFLKKYLSRFHSFWKVF